MSTHVRSCISRFPGITKAEEMLNEIYQNQNRNRTRPCVQSRSDMFRLFKYDINTAAEMSNHTQPLLLTRHNVVPGMFLVSSWKYFIQLLLFSSFLYIKGFFIKLMPSFEVNIRICQTKNSDVHRGKAEVNITFEG